MATTRFVVTTYHDSSHGKMVIALFGKADIPIEINYVTRREKLEHPVILDDREGPRQYSGIGEIRKLPCLRGATHAA